MSSRTAAGRKRIQKQETKPPKEPKDKESGLKGLFSRSKSAAPPLRVPTSPVPSYPSPPSSSRGQPPVQYDRSQQGYPVHSPDIRVSRSETPSGVRALDGYRSPPASGYSASKSPNPYPSPENYYRALSPKQMNDYSDYGHQDYGNPQAMKKAASTSNMGSSFNNHKPVAEQFPTPPSHVFLEASYQPPPPTRPRNNRPLPTNPHTGEAMNPSPYPPEKVPSPTMPYRQLPSPSRSPVPFVGTSSPPLSEVNFSSPTFGRPTLQSSLLLQPQQTPRSPPSPVDLPQYEQAGSSRPYHQLHPSAAVDHRYGESSQNYGGRRGNDYIHKTPSDSDLAYLNSSPVNAHGAWPTNGHGGWPDAAYSPHQTDMVRSPAVSSNATAVPSNYSSNQNTSSQQHHSSHYAASVVSSTSSKKSSSEGSLDKKSPGFVFPGSRSTVKPKISTTTGKTKINLTGKKGKSRVATDEPATPIDSPPTPSPHSPAPRSMARSQNSGQSSSGSSREYGGSVLSHDDNISTRARKMSTATTDTADTTGTSGSSAASGNSNPQPFVFPGGRSRAQPKMQPLTMSSLKLGAKKGKNRRNSVGSGISDKNGRAKFMGISLKKKKSDLEIVRPGTPPSPLAFTLLATSERSYEGSQYEGSQIGSTTSGGGPAGPEFEAYKETRKKQMSPEVRRHERVKRIKSRIGSYPLDPYDSILLDNDRHTGDLLNRLNGTGSPSFYEYGSDPPTTVLDLGCGQGHWVVDAAIAWKGHGTKVTGYDMVDISKVLLPWAIKQGVADNIRFVRGNFLKQRLPFNDNSFDLVRMSSLTLCITADAWIFVFQEVCRVLTVGGRLELIDDSIIFPYGKAPSSSMSGIAAPSTPQLNMFAPRLDINIPSSAFTTFCIYDDSDHPNPGLGFPEDDDNDDDDLLDLYQVKEEGESDLDDTATLSGKEPEARIDRATFQRDPRGTPVARNRSRATQTSSRLRSWNRHAATSKDLESLFEHMLTHKFGIHMSPEEFVLDLMKDVFGHAREMRTMHLSLAPPDIVDDDHEPARGRSEDSSKKSHDRYGSFGSNFKHIPSPSPARTVRSQRMVGTPLSRSPGLVLSPSTFIPMTQQELEIHASKHLRMLLSAKKFLVEHAMEATEDEEIDEDSVLEALWEYEGFLRARFNRPPDFGGRDRSPSVSDNASLRESILSVSSDGQDAMWEYQSELRQRFAWTSDGPESPTTSRSQITPKIASFPGTSSTGAGSSQTSEPSSGGAGSSTNPSSNGRPGSPVGSIAPPYSLGEMTHVRTFRIYEAIKLDESMMSFGS